MTDKMTMPPIDFTDSMAKCFNQQQFCECKHTDDDKGQRRMTTLCQANSKATSMQTGVLLLCRRATLKKTIHIAAIKSNIKATMSR